MKRKFEDGGDGDLRQKWVGRKRWDAWDACSDERSKRKGRKEVAWSLVQERAA